MACNVKYRRYTHLKSEDISSAILVSDVLVAFNMAVKTWEVKCAAQKRQRFPRK